MPEDDVAHEDRRGHVAHERDPAPAGTGGRGSTAATAVPATRTTGAATSPAARGADGARDTTGAGRIGEIDGLRGVALTLVVLFHVFGAGRVSGGVDVFLVISGFLTTRAVLRRATAGRLTVSGAWSRDLVRLAPTALLVLLAVAAGTFALLPAGRWESVLREVAASATSWENWRLVHAELAYGAAGPAASPLQHFWSLAVQVQYLAALPVVALGCVALAARWRRLRGRRITPERLFGALLGVATAASFGYAVWLTAVAQPIAYFHTLARIWEIGAGGLLALAAGRVRMSAPVRRAAAWAGLAAVVGCGFLFDGGRLFPGPATLVPVAGALLVLLAADAGAARATDDSPASDGVLAAGRGTAAAGGTAAGRSATVARAWPGLFARLLGGPVPRWLATISYALYLWHWPLLIAWLAVTGRPRAGVLDGAAVVAVSVLLAWATTRWVARSVERWAARPAAPVPARPQVRISMRSPRVRPPQDEQAQAEQVQAEQVRRVRPGRVRPRRRIPVRAGVLLGTTSLVLAGGAWASADGIERGRVAELAALTEPSADHPGAAALRPGRAGHPAATEVPFRPSTTIAARDGRHVTDCANNKKASSEVVTCVIAAPADGEPTRRVYLVGGSHTQHWEDAWVQVAEDAGWEVTAMIKQGCRLTAGPETFQEFCGDWSAAALERVIAERPDAVVVEGTQTSADGTDFVAPEQAAAWEEITAAGIPVIGVRDTPRFDHHVPTCLSAHRNLPRQEAVAACSVPRADVFDDAFPPVADGRTGTGDTGTGADTGSDGGDDNRADDGADDEPGAAAGDRSAAPAIVHLDLTDAICGPDTCDVVVGNVLVYRDTDHLTGTYAETLGPDLDVAVRTAAPWLFEQDVAERSPGPGPATERSPVRRAPGAKPTN
ncbi:acyltransferase family protein [Myceligenerans pegani]|uniref:Acyltransferase n=1 Tax=Myceligenerans pegani TaxID=2776917 RepID=A0ABR9MZA9_9MICO|nr:acyltransferase family protein [Myceligenerans sp. TRM 65318]MBE1876722.1 acyltransferase [Myceligenerans sp. TRM 65318]MBE3018993.1 acyltransferase [Myceligenerans sp. TRM 65318]